MASIESLIRSKKNKVEQHQRTIAQIKIIIADLERLAADLDLQMRAEEERTKIHDIFNFAYSTLAKATIQRRNNLKQSIGNLTIQLGAALSAMHVATEELETAEEFLHSHIFSVLPAVQDRADN